MITRVNELFSDDIFNDFLAVNINEDDCRDTKDDCEEIANDGECLKKFSYVLKHCPWSCRFCKKKGRDTKKCKDLVDTRHCTGWKSNDDCRMLPDFMMQNCKLTCELCGPGKGYTAILI